MYNNYNNVAVANEGTAAVKEAPLSLVLLVLSALNRDAQQQQLTEHVPEQVYRCSLNSVELHFILLGDLVGTNMSHK